MKKYKYQIILCVIIFLLYDAYIKDRIFISSLEMSEKEQAEIASFYEINSDAIVSGKDFDFKYAYRDPKRPVSSTKVEMVSKHQEAMKIMGISFYDKNGTELCTTQDMEIDFISTGDGRFLLFFRAYNYHDGYVRNGYLEYGRCAQDFYTSVDPEIGKYDLSEISVTIRKKAGLFDLTEQEETYHMVYDEEKYIYKYTSIEGFYVYRRNRGNVVFTAI